MTSNIQVLSDNSYKINTNVFINGLLETCNIIPESNGLYSLGNYSNRYSNLYLDGNLLVGEVDIVNQLNINSNFLKDIIGESNKNLINLVNIVTKMLVIILIVLMFYK